MTPHPTSTLIVGAGVAGMAAALHLAKQGCAVHLVEKSDHPGGHAAKWACMATDTCQNCGACLSIDMADQIEKTGNITTHFATILKTVKKISSGYDIGLGNSDSFAVSKIILATGFSPFDTALAPSYHHDTHKNVITTAQLNTLLCQEQTDGLFSGKKDPKIAFIQCVGSRDRSQGRDYCSQVCCKISMRHTKKLTHLYKDADITLFYMDLQVIGKETRTLLDTLPENIKLAQGVPAEILKDPDTGMLSMVTEDSQSGTRVANTFDLVVLSVGMQPADHADQTAKILNLTPNSWGFFNTEQAVAADDVIVAGCANGPKDILSAIQEGRIAASKALQQPEKNIPVAIIGKGATADTVSERLSENGYDTYLFGAGSTLEKNSSVTILNDSDIISVGGAVGNFSIFYQSAAGKQTLSCAAIIDAEEAARKSNTLLSGKHIMALDDLALMVDKKAEKFPDTCAVLLDYFGPENKISAQKAIKTAITARDNGKDICIICNKILVNGALGQRQYDLARQKGVRFFRFAQTRDLEFKETENGMAVTLKEATLPGIALDLHFNTIALPQTFTPSDNIRSTASHLGQQMDKEGFAQSANVRHRPVQSPCRGIFFAGTGHDETDQTDLENEINEIAAALAVIEKRPVAEPTGVEINEKKCAQCLTCLRICPHNAIALNDKNRPQILPDACFACHLCVSNCPAYAIESDAFSNDKIADAAEKGKAIILACQRSAALAAKPVKLPENTRILTVPCACRISTDILLRLLVNGASRVMICGCHEENCQSIIGSRVAHAGVRQIVNIPGIAPSLVSWDPVAANETRKFERIISTAKQQ